MPTSDPANQAAARALIAAAGLGDLAAVFKTNAQANAAGNTTLSIPATTRHHIETITFSGTTRTSVIIIPLTGRQDGDVVKLRIFNPAGAGISQEIRSVDAAGDVITSTYSDDGSAAIEMFIEGGVLKLFSKLQPTA